MAEKLTPQQEQAVNDRGGNLLVSAAAGSGKTKVLVDRLLSYLTDPSAPANIDEFLIITYTKAAAAELRGKIAAKLTERIAQVPENRHLQQQLQRLYLTKISTVHSFCGDILREYAYILDLSADFRVADENECIQLQSRALQKVLDEAYEQADQDADFCAFVDTQGFGRDDRQIPEILLKVYNSAKCHLDPNGWLQWCLDSVDNPDIEDVSQTVWGQYLIQDLHRYLDLQIDALRRCADEAAFADEMQKPAQLLSDTVSQLCTLRNCVTWDEIRRNMCIDYGRLTFSKKCTDLTLVERIKAVREACKAGLTRKLRRFSDDSNQLLEDFRASAAAARGLVALVKKFDKAYEKQKRSRRVLDFSDLEHKTLDLLLGKMRSGPTAAASEIGERFREVMVDEYQDSNAVQDAIFGALTGRKQNCFMVGDVKQSIYQFRLADPGIFLEKYNRFVHAEDAQPGQGRKIMLSKNFRSSGGVIKSVNDVFGICMSPDLGGLYYGEEEKLVEGVSHVPLNEPEVELFGVDVQEDTYLEEASFVADKIQALLDGTHMVREGDVLRPIMPEDIAILLRSPGSVGGEFVYALEQQGIRCSTGGSDDLLQAEEIEVFRSILQVISNPRQDIPLVAALSSRVFGFTADKLAAIRGKQPIGDFYTALESFGDEKVNGFLDILASLRRDAQMNNLSHLLMRIMSLTRMDSIYGAMADGEIRVENLHAFCQLAASFESGSGCDLRQFLNHLDAIAERGLAAPGEQKATGAVTIMSIHKSKGLEFPVVFLCGLSRRFNTENTKAQVLCDKELGLGLGCVDSVNRVRYPTIAKRAIAAKQIAEGLSEELRVLYVAMTRARDRLIMTYAVKNVADELEGIDLRLSLSDPKLLAGDADCPGLWVLLAARMLHGDGWFVEIVQADESALLHCDDEETVVTVPQSDLQKIKESIAFRYPYSSACDIPSKQTATQLKGRGKDAEIAQDSLETYMRSRHWKRPSFVEKTVSGTTYGNALHKVMQYIRYEVCTDCNGVAREISRLEKEEFISAETAALADPEKIAAFFATDLGQYIRNHSHVLREFKLSVLEDAAKYYPGVNDEKILLQGVVDCAIIDPDGIIVVDFKTDRVTNKTVHIAAQRYTAQLTAYASALERIYELPVKAAKLYFFNINSFVDIM